MNNIMQFNQPNYQFENGYGQFIDLELLTPVATLNANIPRIDNTTLNEYDVEYNAYLDRCENSLEYGIPTQYYMDRNEVIPYNVNISIFTNPVVCFISYLGKFALSWVKL